MVHKESKLPTRTNTYYSHECIFNNCPKLKVDKFFRQLYKTSKYCKRLLLKLSNRRGL